MQPAEACKMLGGICRTTFVAYATTGINGRVLNAFKIGNRWYTDEASIEAFKHRPGGHETAVAASNHNEERRERFGF